MWSYEENAYLSNAGNGESRIPKRQNIAANNRKIMSLKLGHYILHNVPFHLTRYSDQHIFSCYSCFNLPTFLRCFIIIIITFIWKLITNHVAFPHFHAPFWFYLPLLFLFLQIFHTLLKTLHVFYSLGKNRNLVRLHTCSEKLQVSYIHAKQNHLCTYWTIYIICWIFLYCSSTMFSKRSFKVSASCIFNVQQKIT